MILTADFYFLLQRPEQPTAGDGRHTICKGVFISYFGIRFWVPHVRIRSWRDRDVATLLLVQRELARERYDKYKTLIIEHRL